MGTYGSFVLATLPRRRAASALRRARDAASAARSDPRVAHARAVQASRFRADTRPPFTLGRAGVMSWSDDPEALDDVDRAVVDRLSDGASELWRVRMQPVRVDGDWSGFVPDVDGVAPLDLDEPVVVIIHGILKLRHSAKFARDNAQVGRQLQSAAGYLGGVGLSDTPMTTTSFSCWRSWRDSRAFAFGQGAHQRAYKVDVAEQRHKTQFFVRLRPLASSGTVDGHDPFAGLLPSARHAPPQPLADA